MEFKIFNTDVKLSFTFLSLFLVFIIFDKQDVFLSTFLAAAIHELTHILFTYIFKMNIKNIEISIFGGNIKRERGKSASYTEEAIINLSAPVMNIIIGALLYLISKKQNHLSISNLILGTFNLLPFYSFDGGKGLELLLKIKLSEKTVNKIIVIMSVLITFFVGVISVLIFLNNHNFSLFIICGYMILTLLFKK